MSRILVTGAASGLGKAIFNSLKENGHEVFQYDKSSPDGGDVANPGSNISMLGYLDVLINCAGIGMLKPFGELTDEDWDRVMNTNVKGIFKMTRAFLPQLLKSKGAVLNIISTAAFVPMTSSSVYNSSKAAANMLTLQMAREYRGKLTVFGIAPNRMKGTGQTEYIDGEIGRLRNMTREQVDRLQESYCGEPTPPEVIANFVSYLLAHKDNHRFLTGVVLQYGHH